MVSGPSSYTWLYGHCEHETILCLHSVIQSGCLSFWCSNFRFEWVCLLKRLVHHLIVALHIVAFKNHHGIRTYETYWFWLADGTDDLVRAHSRFKALFSAVNFFSLEHPMTIDTQDTQCADLIGLVASPEMICSLQLVYGFPGSAKPVA